MGIAAPWSWRVAGRQGEEEGRKAFSSSFSYPTTDPSLTECVLLQPTACLPVSDRYSEKKRERPVRKEEEANSYGGRLQRLLRSPRTVIHVRKKKKKKKKRPFSRFFFLFSSSQRGNIAIVAT